MHVRNSASLFAGQDPADADFFGSQGNVEPCFAKIDLFSGAKRACLCLHFPAVDGPAARILQRDQHFRHILLHGCRINDTAARDEIRRAIFALVEFEIVVQNNGQIGFCDRV